MRLFEQSENSECSVKKWTVHRSAIYDLAAINILNHKSRNSLKPRAETFTQAERSKPRQRVVVTKN